MNEKKIVLPINVDWKKVLEELKRKGIEIIEKLPGHEVYCYGAIVIHRYLARVGSKKKIIVVEYFYGNCGSNCCGLKDAEPCIIIRL